MDYFLSLFLNKIPITGCIFFALTYGIFILIYRLTNEKYEGGVDDELGQYTMQIKGIWQKSICPRLYSYNEIKGYYCYPLAFAWLCGQAGKVHFLQNLFKRSNDLNPLFPSLDSDKSTQLKTSLLLFKALSALVLPIITQLLALILILVIGNFSLVSLLIGISSALIMDSIFTPQRYAVSTRNIGYFLYMNFSLISLYILFGKHILIAANNLSIFVFTGSVLIVSLLIHQCSQRSSQTFLVLLVLLFMYVPSIRIEIICAYLVSQLMLLQIPFTNYSEFIRSHLYNRIHDAEWSSRLYGHFRYGLCRKLHKNTRETFKQDLLSLDFLKTHMTGDAYYKSNWFSIFAVHRIYLYMMVIIFTSYTANYEITLPITIFLLSAIAPSILSFFRPFQGYGSSEVYVWSNIPFAYISCVPYVINSIKVHSSIISIIISTFILAEVAYITCKGLWFRYEVIKSKRISLFNICRFSNVWDASASAFSSSKSMNHVTSFIEQITDNSLPLTVKGKRLRMMALEMHTQSFIEVISMYINGMEKSKTKLIPAFVQLDNISYGYFNDYKAFVVNPNVIFSKIKPDILLVDTSRPQSLAILKQIVRIRPDAPLFRSDSLVLLRLSKNVKLIKK